jgi:segregation and condensation protein B
MGKKRRKKEEPAPVEETPAEDVSLPEAEGSVDVAPSAEPSVEIESSAEQAETADEPVTAEEPVVEEPVSEESSVEKPTSAEADATETESDASGAESEAPELRYQLKQVLEAIMFASQKPLSAKEMISVLKGAAEAEKEKPNSHATPFAKVKEAQLRAAVEELELDYSDPGRTYEVRESAAGWQLVTKPDYAPWLRQLFPENRSARLSAPAMETLAIIAYRQPITRADIEAVRGVAVDGVMQTLLDRGLIKIDGRADIPGRPLLYGTTQNFMEHFGLKNLGDLPNADELRKISLPTAEPPAPETPKESATDTAPAEAASEPTPEAPAETHEEAVASAEPGAPEETPAELESPEETVVEIASADTEADEPEKPESPVQP